MESLTSTHLRRPGSAGHAARVTPRYVRFARALALVSATSAAGCYQAHERSVDAGPVDAFVADVPDAWEMCPRPLPCTCPRLGSDGTCGDRYALCCPIVGPLSPPSLATGALSSSDSRA
jgi:hypothetical protein